MFVVSLNYYVSLSLTNRKSSVKAHDLYSTRTALRTFTPPRDQLVLCGQYTGLCLCIVDACEVRTDRGSSRT
jgi:hypothetical protein